MADDMTTNGASSFDPIAQYARLSERVENQGKDIVDLRSNMNTGFQNIQSAISSLTNELRGSTKTQWPVIWSAVGVCFTVLATLGGFFYMSLKSDQARFDSTLLRVVDNSVSRQEMDWRAARGTEDRDRTNTAIVGITSEMVPRAELERTWQNYDQRFSDQQRQINELKTEAGSVYNQRDVIRDILERLDRAERNRSSVPG